MTSFYILKLECLKPCFESQKVIKNIAQVSKNLGKNVNSLIILGHANKFNKISRK